MPPDKRPEKEPAAAPLNAPSIKLSPAIRAFPPPATKPEANPLKNPTVAPPNIPVVPTIPATAVPTAQPATLERAPTPK